MPRFHKMRTSEVVEWDTNDSRKVILYIDNFRVQTPFEEFMMDDWTWSYVDAFRKGVAQGQRLAELQAQNAKEAEDKIRSQMEREHMHDFIVMAWEKEKIRRDRAAARAAKPPKKKRRSVRKPKRRSSRRGGSSG